MAYTTTVQALNSLAGNVNRIPHYVSATNPKGLMAEMLKINLRDGVEYNYSITFDGKKWVAWYRKELDIKSRFSGLSDKSVEQVNGSTGR